MSARAMAPGTPVSLATLASLAISCSLVAGCEARLSLGGLCTRTSDCAEPLVCSIGGRCREACVTSRDCPIGLHCVRDPEAPDPTVAPRTCALESDECRARTCERGLVCYEGRCVNECRLGDDCPDGVCRSGACAPILPGVDAGADVGAVLDAAGDVGLDAAEIDVGPDAPEPMDAGADAGPDGGPDAPLAMDAGPDTPPEADAGPDAPVELDGGPDAPLGPDAGPDAPTAPDGGPDAPPLGTDGGVPRATEEATVRFGPALLGDQIGWSVAMSADGSRVLVGAPEQDAGAALRAGTVAVLVRAGTVWSLEATLVASVGAAVDLFGYSVALSADGSVALVGAPSDDVAGRSDAGSATVFVRTGTTWTEEALLIAPDGASNDWFGRAVALAGDGTRALVGVPPDTMGPFMLAGSARVFLRTGTTWAEEATLVAPDRADDDLFGASVALSADGSRALVGVPYDDTAGGAGTGSVRVFLRAGTAWTQEAMLVPAGGMAGDVMGSSVALSPDASFAVAGAIADDTGAPDAGSVRVYSRAGTLWTEDAILAASDGATGDSFGSSVALSADGSWVLCGASGDDTAAGMNAGSVRLFGRSGMLWSEETTLLAPDAAPFDAFGVAVALAADASRAIVGASLDDDSVGIQSGSARIFVLGPP